MNITSFLFLVFLLVTFCVFYLVPVKFRWLVLLAASIYFYLQAGALKFFPFIIFTSLVIWVAARWIGQIYEEQETRLKQPGLDKAEKKKIKEIHKKKAKSILVIALVLCVGILCVTKFAKYAVLYLNALTGSQRFGVAWLIVPLGISYYTFSTVGYLLDVYWKRYTYERNFLRFFLYAIYFPHIIQGPISRYNLLGAELKKELRFDSLRIAHGMELMLWGFFKKLVIADRLNIFVSNVYNGESHAGSIFLVAMIFDAFQIYTDFSGYTDIVRGASQIFGLELEQNFNHPFFSKNVPEFWRRWHMTLGGWFKDYVYYPCTISHFVKDTGKKAKKRSDRLGRFILIAIPVFVTWVLTGLWHGTGKTYLAWGIYYGTLITISTAFQPEFQKVNQLLHINTEAYSWKVFQMIRTFCCFMGGRVLTSPGSLHRTLLVAKNMIRYFNIWHLSDGVLLGYGLGWSQFFVIIVSILVLWIVSMMQERFSVREAMDQQNMVIRWLMIWGLFFVIIIWGIYGPAYDSTAFLYQQF